MLKNPEQVGLYNYFQEQERRRQKRQERQAKNEKRRRDVSAERNPESRDSPKKTQSATKVVKNTMKVKEAARNPNKTSERINKQDKINGKRGVTKPRMKTSRGRERFSPEQMEQFRERFSPDVSVREIVEGYQEKIKKGYKMTNHDAAVVAAAYQNASVETSGTDGKIHALRGV